MANDQLNSNQNLETTQCASTPPSTPTTATIANAMGATSENGSSSQSQAAATEETSVHKAHRQSKDATEMATEHSEKNENVEEQLATEATITNNNLSEINESTSQDQINDNAQKSVDPSQQAQPEDSLVFLETVNSNCGGGLEEQFDNAESICSTTTAS